MVSTFKNKKGQSMGYFEIILVVAILFIVAVVWLVFDNFSSEINQYVLQEDFLTNEEAINVVEDIEERRSDTFDSMFILFVLGMFFLGGISAWYAGSNPIFMVITILFMIMVLVIPAFLGDAWFEVTEEFDSSNLSFMSWVMNNHLLFSTVFVFFTLGVMYFKSRLDL